MWGLKQSPSPSVKQEVMFSGGRACRHSLVRMHSRNRYSVYEMMPLGETESSGNVKPKMLFLQMFSLSFHTDRSTGDLICHAPSGPQTQQCGVLGGLQTPSLQLRPLLFWEWGPTWQPSQPAAASCLADAGRSVWRSWLGTHLCFGSAEARVSSYSLSTSSGPPTTECKGGGKACLQLLLLCIQM